MYAYEGSIRSKLKTGTATAASLVAMSKGHVLSHFHKQCAASSVPRFCLQRKLSCLQCLLNVTKKLFGIRSVDDAMVKAQSEVGH